MFVIESSSGKHYLLITCQGVSNIAEVMDEVKLQFKIDDDWFSMSMAYNPQTTLYEALIPSYNQLANKTIQIYIVARTKLNQFLNSNIYIYNVPNWVKADINRDGKVNIKDVSLIGINWQKP